MNVAYKILQILHLHLISQVLEAYPELYLAVNHHMGLALKQLTGWCGSQLQWSTISIIHYSLQHHDRLSNEGDAPRDLSRRAMQM